MLRRWWWVFLVMFPLGLLIGLAEGSAWTYIIPKKYEAQAIMGIRPSQEAVLTPGSFVSEFEAITSRETLTAVAD